MKAKNMKNMIRFVAVVMFTVSINAQQDPQYTQYMYNMNILNPAYAGSHDYLSVNVLTRAQWLGIEGSPRTLTLGGHAPVGKNVGLGLSAIVDKLGPLGEQNIYGDFSYTLTLNERSKLAFGIKGGFTFFNVDLSQLRLVNDFDPSFVNNKVNKILPNIGVGAFYYTDKFYAGLSIPNMLETLEFKKKGGQVTQVAERNHYFFTTGYVFDLNDEFKFKPSTLLKVAEGTPLSMDISANIQYANMLEFGASWRFNESASVLINVMASENLRIGYAYDHTLTNLSNFNSGSHELFLLFNFNFVEGKIRSPRFF